MDSDTTLISVIADESIAGLIGSSYPRVGEMLTHDLEATVELLTRAQAKVLTHKRFVEQVDINARGSDHSKNQEQYTGKIKHFLYHVSIDKKMKQGRDAVAEEIREKHLIAYPSWPLAGETQEHYITLDSQNKYTYGHLNIFWSVSGSICIKDSCNWVNWWSLQKRYETKISGTPEIKFVEVNSKNMEFFESAANEDSEEAMSTVDRMRNKILIESFGNLAT